MKNLIASIILVSLVSPLSYAKKNLDPDKAYSCSLAEANKECKKSALLEAKFKKYYAKLKLSAPKLNISWTCLVSPDESGSEPEQLPVQITVTAGLKNAYPMSEKHYKAYILNPAIGEKCPIKELEEDLSVPSRKGVLSPPSN